jgi:hypothetical protein
MLKVAANIGVFIFIIFFDKCTDYFCLATDNEGMS